MADNRLLSNISVSVNNTAILYVAGSLKYDEGLGEQKIIPQAGGGGQVAMAFADDISTRKGKASFEMLPTASNIALARSWKINANGNIVKLSATGSSFNKTFANAAIVNTYEVGLSADGKISVNFESDPAV